jgi:YidC/Oxa1 family membrane protein insertase
VNPFALIGAFFQTVFFRPIVTLLVGIIDLLNKLHIPGSMGLSIILLTVLIRLLVWPFMASQLRVTKKMAEVKPHLDKLKEKHGTDKQALALAQAALYKEHGINPAGGCLPSLIQIPIIISLYQSILLIFNGQGLDKINQLLYIPSLKLTSKPDPNFLGLNLAGKPSDFAHIGLFVLLIPVLTALFQFIQSTMMTPTKPVKAYPSDSPKEKKEKEGSEDTMMAVQNQMRFMMPLMIGYFSFSFPTGLSLYWNTLTLVGILQQYLLSGWGGMSGIAESAKRIVGKSKINN